MKYLLLLSVLLLAGCQDNLRSRAPLCPNNVCIEALSVGTTKLVAEIVLTVEIYKNQLVFKSSDHSVDIEDSRRCEISAEAGKSFSYKISGDKLQLKDGLTQLSFYRSGGDSESGLVNTWVMPPTANSDQLELEFLTPTLLHIRKVCLKS